MAVIYAVVVAETAGHHAPMTKRAITIWHVYTAEAVSLPNAVYSLSFSNILELSKISRDFYSWKLGRVGGEVCACLPFVRSTDCGFLNVLCISRLGKW